MNERERKVKKKTKRTTHTKTRKQPKTSGAGICASNMTTHIFLHKNQFELVILNGYRCRMLRMFNPDCDSLFVQEKKK